MKITKTLYYQAREKIYLLTKLCGFLDSLTGGSPRFEKITEIAIYVHDGTNVIDEFCTLINPEKYIPPFITSLTGITNEMVENAPKFYEIARKIVEITEGFLSIVFYRRLPDDQLGWQYNPFCKGRTIFYPFEK